MPNLVHSNRAYGAVVVGEVVGVVVTVDSVSVGVDVMLVVPVRVADVVGVVDGQALHSDGQRARTVGPIAPLQAARLNCLWQTMGSGWPVMPSHLRKSGG